MSKFKMYRKFGYIEARPYEPGEDLSNVSVSKRDCPELGGMIARNPVDTQDMWYINPAFFEANYEER